jgi:predicted ATPase
VPDTIREMIEVGIARLSLEEQQALEIASAMGVVFSAEDCATLSKLDPNELDELFDAMARRQQIIRRTLRYSTTGSRGSETFEFAHALYREVLFQGMPRNRRARLERNRGEHRELWSFGSQDALLFPCVSTDSVVAIFPSAKIVG